MKSIGIDIGSSSIKIVEMSSHTKGFQYDFYKEYPLNIAPGADQELEIIEILRNFVQSYDPTQTRFVLGLRQDRVAIRNKFFPFNDRIKISKSLAFELEEDLPFSSDNSIFDAKIIKTVGAGAEVLACAAPKQHVEDLILRAKDAGIDPSILSAEGTAAANVLENWYAAPPATVAPSLTLDSLDKPLRHLRMVVNIGHSRTLVSAFEGPSLVAVRSILWGGKNIAESIAAKYEIPFLEAIKELQTKAFILTNKQGASFDQVTFSETIAKAVREMSRDLQLSILDLKSEFNANITEVALTGGASQVKNLGPFLTQILEIPVNKLQPLDRIPNVIFDRNSATQAKASVAMGLAMEGFKKPRNPALNFLRGEFAKENQKVKLFWKKWGHTAKVASAFVFILFVYTSLREGFSTSLLDKADTIMKDQAKVVANLKGRELSEAGVKKYIRDNKKRAADLKTLQSIIPMNSALDIVKKISDSAPAKGHINMDVTTLRVEDSKVVIQGFVDNAQQASLLQKALLNVASDGKVSALPAGGRPQAGKVSFGFAFTVDRGIQKVIR